MVRIHDFERTVGGKLNGKIKGEKATRRQKILMQSANLVPKNWLVLKETETGLLVVNRGSGKARTVKK